MIPYFSLRTIKEKQKRVIPIPTVQVITKSGLLRVPMLDQLSEKILWFNRKVVGQRGPFGPFIQEFTITDTPNKEFQSYWPKQPGYGGGYDFFPIHTSVYSTFREERGKAWKISQALISPHSIRKEFLYTYQAPNLMNTPIKYQLHRDSLMKNMIRWVGSQNLKFDNKEGSGVLPMDTQGRVLGVLAVLHIARKTFGKDMQTERDLRKVRRALLFDTLSHFEGEEGVRKVFNLVQNYRGKQDPLPAKITRTYALDNNHLEWWPARNYFTNTYFNRFYTQDPDIIAFYGLEPV